MVGASASLGLIERFVVERAWQAGKHSCSRGLWLAHTLAIRLRARIFSGCV